MRVGNFVIQVTESQGPLGNHYDIFVDGSEDSIITVWDSLNTAKTICKSLNKKIELEKISISDESTLVHHKKKTCR